MKRVRFLKLVSLSGMALLAAPSCTDLVLESSEPQLTPDSFLSDSESIDLANGAFHPRVGGTIPTTKARVWTNEFIKTNTSENYFQIKRADLLEMLDSNDCNGVMFQLAIDDEDKTELILARMNSKGELMSDHQFATTGRRNTNLF
jgi:hypothetical protein